MTVIHAANSVLNNQVKGHYIGYNFRVSLRRMNIVLCF